MTDEELQYINDQRMGKNLINRQGQPCRFLKRLARTKKGFIQAQNQAQKIAIERKEFPESENKGIDEICKTIKAISNKFYEKPFYLNEKIEMEVGD